jgi:hypothetical protein
MAECYSSCPPVSAFKKSKKWQGFLARLHALQNGFSYCYQFLNFNFNKPFSLSMVPERLAAGRSLPDSQAHSGKHCTRSRRYHCTPPGVMLLTPFKIIRSK